MTTIVLTYYKERVKYIEQIVHALKQSTIKTDIIIFNQGENPLPELRGVTVINSERNFGCSVRHALALCIDDDYFFFQDDDLLVEPDTIKKLRRYATLNNVVGIEGSILTDGYYTTATTVTQNNIFKEATHADIILGRVHLCSKLAIIRAFKLREELMLRIFRDDDILLSLANNYNKVVRTEIINLDEQGVGLSYEKNHYTERNLTCKTIYETIKN